MFRGLALFAAITACRVTGSFECETAMQCRQNGETGFCEASGYCSFTDEACESRHRYEDAAGAGLASKCVTTIVTGRYRERYLVNDATFSPIVMERVLPADQIAFAATLPDGSPSEVSYLDDGTFSFPILDGERYQLAITVGGTETLYQHRALRLDLGRVGAGRLDRAPVTLPTTIRIEYPSTPAGAIGVVASTGVFTQTLLFAVNNVDFPWRNAATFTDAIGLLDASKLDRLYYLLFGVTDGYRVINSVATHDITQTDGGTIRLQSGLNALPADQCARITGPAAADATRLQTIFGAQNTASNWFVNASPSPNQVGRLASMWLAFESSSPATNADRVVNFANPFPGTSVTAFQGTIMTRIVTLPNATTPLVLNHALNTIYPLSPIAGGCVPVTLDNRVGISAEVSVGGVKLTRDDHPAVLDLSGNIPVAWSQLTGPVDWSNVSLYELTNVAGRTEVTHIATVLTEIPEAMLPKELLVPGRTYIIEIVARYSPTSGAASGDYMTIGLPASLSTTWSYSFQVAAP